MLHVRLVLIPLLAIIGWQFFYIVVNVGLFDATFAMQWDCNIGYERVQHRRFASCAKLVTICLIVLHQRCIKFYECA